MEELINVKLSCDDLDCIIGWGEVFEDEYGNSRRGLDLLNKLKTIEETIK